MPRLVFLYLIYPGLTIFDSISSIAQFYGIPTHTASVSSTPEWILTDHHLLIFTFLMGSAVKIGEMLGSQNFGFCLYIILQIIISNIILVYCLSVFRTKFKKLYNVFILIFFLLPQFTIWQCTMSKDSYFSVFLLLLCCLVYQTIGSEFQFLHNKKFFLLIVITSLLCCFMKHQGAYILLITALILFILYKGKAQKIIIVFFLIGISYLTVYTNIILPRTNVSKTGNQEALGFMFQQTARYAVDYGDEVTDYEKDVIDQLLPFNDLSELYDPSIQDPVKFKYNQKAGVHEIWDYVKVWIVMFFKHPDAYYHATVDNTIKGYWFDFSSSMQFFPSYIQSISIARNNPELRIQNIQDFAFRNELRESLLSIGDIPVLHLLFSYPFYNWTLIGAFLILLFRKDKKNIAAFFPILLSMLILVVSPVAHFRYFLPVLYAWPLILGSAFVSDKAYTGETGSCNQSFQKELQTDSPD